METKEVETIKKKTYKKPTSISNAEKARQARAKKIEELKNKQHIENESDYSEDEIVYIPTTRKTKNKITNKEPENVADDDMTKKEIIELKKAILFLQQNNNKTKESPEPPVPQQKTQQQHIEEHLRMKILNF